MRASQTLLLMLTCLALAVNSLGAGVSNKSKAIHPESHDDPFPELASARQGTIALRNGNLVSESPNVGNAQRTDCHGDPLPEGAIARLGTVRLRHGNFVSCVTFSPDGAFLVSAGTEGTIRFWDLPTGKEIRRLSGHGNITCLTFSPDGKILASADHDAIVRLWDSSGRETRCFSHESDVMSLGFSSDGKILAAGERRGQIVLRDVSTGNELRRFPGALSKGQPLAFTSDNKAILCSKKNVVQLCSVETGKPIRQFQGHTGEVSALALSPTGQVLASGSENGGIRLWDIANGRELSQFSGHGREVTALTFAPDGKTLASQGSDLFLCLWNVASGQSLFRVKESTWSGDSLAFSPDGKLLAHTAGDCTVYLRETATGKRLLPTEGHRNLVRCVTFSPDGKTVASTSWDTTVRLWDALSGRQLRQLGPSLERFRAVAFSPDGKTMATTGEGEGANLCKLWQIETGAETQQFRAYCVDFLSFTDGGNALVMGDMADEIQVFWTGRREVRQLTSTGQKPIYHSNLAVSPDGRTVAASTLGHKGIRFWDLVTGRERAWEEQGCPLGFSSSGNLLAVARDGIDVQEVATGKLAYRLACAENIHAAAFSPDGRTLAIVENQKESICLVDLGTGQKRFPFPGHQGWISHACFSPDGKLLATSSMDSTVLIWDMTSLASKTKAPSLRRSPEKLKSLWRELDDADPAKAYKAVWALAASPEQAPAFILDCLRFLFIADQKRIERLLTDLDNDDYATRERASEELERLDTMAEPAIRRALADGPSLDMQKRLEQLLDNLEGLNPFVNRRRLLRAVEVLESIGNEAARQTLRQIQSEAPGIWLKKEVKAALQRLARRPVTTMNQ